MRYHFNPRKKTCVGSVTLNNVPGALAQVANTLASRKVNLVSSESANSKGSDTSVWGFFAEIEDPSVEVSQLKSLVAGLPNVVGVEISEGIDGIVVDKYHYPLYFNSGEKAMVISRRNLVDMFSRVKKIFGSGAEVIIYEMGAATGEDDAKELARGLGKDILARNMTEMVFLYAAQGWGMPELVDLTLEPLTTILRIHDNFECAYVRSGAPNSQYIRGHLVGLAGGVLGKKVMIRETKCMAMGDKYCEFHGEEVI